MADKAAGERTRRHSIAIPTGRLSKSKTSLRGCVNVLRRMLVDSYATLSGVINPKFSILLILL